MKDLILLNSDSTNTIFCNAKYVKNICNANVPLQIQTNGSFMIANKICDIVHLGTQWFNDKAADI